MLERTGLGHLREKDRGNVMLRGVCVWVMLCEGGKSWSCYLRERGLSLVGEDWAGSFEGERSQLTS